MLEFQLQNILVKDDKTEESRSEYCIVLVDIDTGYPVWITGLEAYVVDRNLAEGSEAYIKKHMGVVVTFLNWIKGRCLLHEVNMTVLSNWLRDMKKKSNGEKMSADYWNFARRTVFTFLCNIQTYVPSFFETLDTSDIMKQEFIRDKIGNRKLCRVFASLGVKAPPKIPRKKNRVISLPAILILLEEAEKYDPELVLPIALQCFGGLREGEVVNCRVSSVDIIYNINLVTEINIDICDEAPWHTGRMSMISGGSIKRHREQPIYESFLELIEDIYTQHMHRHQTLSQEKGVDMTKRDGPLFYNKRLRPLTVDTYTHRVGKLFKNHFISRFREECLQQGTYDEYERLIKAYEKEFTGCHAFRHFFTMYLLDVEGLEEEDIKNLRGDASLLSMETYISQNHRYADKFDRGMFAFQKGLKI